MSHFTFSDTIKISSCDISGTDCSQVLKALITTQQVGWTHRVTKSRRPGSLHLHLGEIKLPWSPARWLKLQSCLGVTCITLFQIYIVSQRHSKHHTFRKSKTSHFSLLICYETRVHLYHLLNKAAFLLKRKVLCP